MLSCMSPPPSSRFSSTIALHMATLDQLISSLPADSGQKGKAWERLCQWFLKNDPVNSRQLRRVWLYDEWSGRWGAYNGHR